MTVRQSDLRAYLKIGGSRIQVREVIPCEWIAGEGRQARTRCGETLMIDEIPERVRFCPFCGGPIIGWTGLDGSPGLTPDNRE